MSQHEGGTTAHWTRGSGARFSPVIVRNVVSGDDCKRPNYERFWRDLRESERSDNRSGRLSYFRRTPFVIFESSVVND